MAVRTECPCPWLQDHLSTHQTVPKVQQECQPPANITMQNLTSQKVVAASLYILPDPRPESTRGYAHQPPEQHKHTSTQDGPSIQHTQQKHTREPRTTASQSPSGLVVSHLERILAFLPLESLKPRYTQELWTSEQPVGQAPPRLLAGEPSLHPAGGACLKPGASLLAPVTVSAQHCLLSSKGKLVTWEGKLLSNSLCFCFHLKRLVTLLHVERT